MEKAGKSILWFLGACLFFSQGLITAVAKAFTSVEGTWVLLFGFLCLAMVLGTLLIMFIQNPTFITAERGDLVPLSIIQQVARQNNPDLLKQLIVALSPDAWVSSEVGDEEVGDHTEYEEIEAEVDEGGGKDQEDYQEFINAFNKLGN